MHCSSLLKTRTPGTAIMLRALAAAASLWLVAAGSNAMAAGTLDRIRETGKLNIGYHPGAEPFSYTDSADKPSGYAITLCQKIADAVKENTKRTSLTVNFVPLAGDAGFAAIEGGKIDLMCGAVPTLARRSMVDFSIPVIFSGTGVVVRADAPARLVEALSGRDSPAKPIWRGSQGQAPERGILAVRGDSTIERALIDSLKRRRIVADVLRVKDLQEGLESVRQGRAAAFFDDRGLLLAAVKRNVVSDFVVIDRIFRRESVALGMHRNDDDFRLLVDKTLSRLYLSGDIKSIYSATYGTPDQNVLNFFELSALPE